MFERKEAIEARAQKKLDNLKVKQVVQLPLPRIPTPKALLEFLLLHKLISPLPLLLGTLSILLNFP